MVRADGATHDVCFTAHASAAIMPLAESYPFGPRAQLVLAADNHNSVNDIREYARRAGAAVFILPLDAEIRLADPEPRLAERAARGCGLVTLPGPVRLSLGLASNPRDVARAVAVLASLAA